MKYILEIMMAVSFLILCYAIYLWFQIDSFKWEKDKNAVFVTIIGTCLLISNGDTYLRHKKEKAANESEEL